VRNSQSAKLIIINVTAKVAHAQPAKPSGGITFGMPKTKTMDSGTLTIKAPTCTHVTSFGFPKLRIPTMLTNQSSNVTNQSNSIDQRRS
jgi:hypothetical protein